MQTKELFEDINDVNFEDYMHKSGIEDIDEYLSGQVVEHYSLYNNIEEGAEMVIEWIKKEGDRIVN